MRRLKLFSVEVESLRLRKARTIKWTKVQKPFYDSRSLPIFIVILAIPKLHTLALSLSDTLYIARKQSISYIQKLTVLSVRRGPIGICPS